MTTEPGTTAGYDWSALHRPGHVLIVDDDARNRELLGALIAGTGHEVELAEDGYAALEAIRAREPDVVLLDVMMPGIDGYEVCRRIKAMPAGGLLPVIMVTALQGREDRIQGIRAGADEFLSKPVDREETMLRVRNAVAQRRLSREIEGQHRRLLELERRKDDLVAMLAHDIRSPLTTMLGNLDLLGEDLREADAEIRAMLGDVEASARRIHRYVDSLIELRRMESDAMPVEIAPFELEPVLAEAIRAMPAAERSRFRLELDPGAGAVEADCDLLVRVLVNLLNNAVVHTPPAVPVILRAHAADKGCRRVEVEDRGAGIAAEDLPHLFDPYFVGTRKRRKASTGLGLAFCRIAVESMQGRIGVESEPGRGSCFWLELPAAPE